MKKFLSILTILTLTTSLMVGCSEDIETSQLISNSTENINTSVNLISSDPVEQILQKMSIEEKIGQMAMIGIHGHEINESNVNDDIIYSLNNFCFGGVILFARNIESQEQVKNLTSQLQQNRFNKKVPIFIAIDEEGGDVSRLKLIDSETAPSQQSIGRTANPEEAKYWSVQTAKKLKYLGINVNFAPVADVGSPDTRSFSDNPEEVANFLDNSARGYEEEGIIYCLKHFPGIGKRITDPHQEISSIDVSRETLEQEDLLPFKYIIENHQSDKFMIMVSHLKYPSIDEFNSATLSYEVMTELLRKELGYNGIIITDDLEMGAITNHNSFSEVGVKAIKAGADILLICHEYPHEQEVYNGLLKAVKNGEISEKRIDESVRRILKVKLDNLQK